MITPSGRKVTTSEERRKMEKKMQNVGEKTFSYVKHFGALIIFF
jgi:hypothetical protein